jgi:hypothetical protein
MCNRQKGRLRRLQPGEGENLSKDDPLLRFMAGMPDYMSQADSSKQCE